MIPSEPTAEPESSAENATATEAPALPTESAADAVAEAAQEPVTPSVPAIPAQPVPDVPPAPSTYDLSRIAQDFQIRKGQIEAVVQLLDEGNTVPFIGRYCKERTAGLPEDLVRRIAERVVEIRGFADRKRTILRSIATQGKLTDELTAAILEADHPKWLEDLYQPFKPKKKSLAVEAKLRGWGPLAEAIWANDPAVADLPAVVTGMIDPDTTFTTSDDILTGVKHILAEVIADSIAVRAPVRAFAWDTGTLVSARMEGVPDDKGREFRDFFEYHEPVRTVPPHRYMAIARGEREKVLSSKIVFDASKARDVAADQLPQLRENPHREFLLTVVEDAMSRLLLPNLEREIRKEWTDRAHDQAAHAFARNLRSLLIQPPVRGKRVLAIDPGMRTGCKLVALDENGVVLAYDVAYPLPPQKRVESATKKLEYLIRKHGLNTVAIGNGLGCRDLEHIVSDLLADFADRRLNPRPIVAPTPPPVAMDSATLGTSSVPSMHSEPIASSSVDMAISSPVFATPVGDGSNTSVVSSDVSGEAAVVTTEMVSGNAVVSSPTATTRPEPAKAEPLPEPEIDLTGLPDPSPDLCYLILNEAGAGAYATGAAAKEEFPSLDPVTRGAISIGRRLQDPLAEYVKIDPLHLGPVFHPHEGRPKRLRELLEGVVESCVNEIGVDLNTASLYVLRNISGLNQLIAREIVTHRLSQGPFSSREQLKSIPGMTDERFHQCAGFLRVRNGTEPLDETFVHPERYPLANQLLTGLGFSAADLRDAKKRAAIDDAFRRANAEEWSKTLSIPVPAVIDLMVALVKFGDDSRSELPPPVFKTRVLKVDDLAPGMELLGTVLNVVPFGAFVDIGLRESGLVHISQMANRYVKSPFDLVAVGDVVTVWVVDIKADEKKVSLTMIAPQSVRKPEPPPQRAERPARPAAPPRPQSPPREDRPPADRSQSGSRQSGPPPRPKRFAEPGAWRRAGQAAQPKSPAATAAPAQESAASSTSKKQRAKPVVKLSGEQKQGKAALNSFGQLFAFIKEREETPADGETPDSKAESAKPE